MDLNSTVTYFLTLGGAGALIAALVNVGKAVGLVKDGQAGKWSLGLNLAGLVALALVLNFAPGADVAHMDAVASQVAAALVAILSLVVQLGASRATHAIVRGMPLVGTSHST